MHNLKNFFMLEPTTKYFNIRSLSRPNINMCIINANNILDFVTIVTYFGLWYIITLIEYIIKIDLKENLIIVLIDWMCLILKMNQLVKILKVPKTWFLEVLKILTTLYSLSSLNSFFNIQSKYFFVSLSYIQVALYNRYFYLLY